MVKKMFSFDLLFLSFNMVSDRRTFFRNHNRNYDMNAAFQKAVDLAMWTSQVFILLFVLVDFISIIIWLITVTTVVVFLLFLFFSKCFFFF